MSAGVGWRQVLPRVLLGLVLLALLVSLFAVQRTADEAGRRAEALESAWRELRASAPEGLPGALPGSRADARDDADVRAFEAQLERLPAGGIVPVAGYPVTIVDAAWASLALVALASLLALWLLVDSARRRERRERVDDGRTRREQAAILALLDEISPLASGDLRVRATVSEAMTGALADAFNHAVSELRWLVGTIDRSAAEVERSVQGSRENAQRLVSSCTVQAREIHRSSNHLGTMSETMAELSAHAAECARIATVSVSESESGGQAIVDGVQRLGRIRDESELATRLMQRLAENATAIDERVETIRDVARRTDLLALNTTIRAAASAAAGARLEEQAGADLADATGAWGSAASGDLSRLSEEVTRLADLLGGAARDIASLSRTIRQDADDTVEAMDKANAELASGLAQSEQASDSLESIESVSRELQGLVREMADKALRQSGVVRQLSANMGTINRITADTSRDVQAAASSLDELQDLAIGLRDGVADFRLPPTPRQLEETGTEAAAARAVTRASMRASPRALDHG